MIARHKNAVGAWVYDDDSANDAALRLALMHGIDLVQIDNWIEAEQWPDADQLQRVLGWRERLIHATSDDALEGWGLYLLTLAAFNQREAFMHPLAGQGVKFRKGRKPGTVGKVRAWVRKHMKKHPAAKPAEAWEAFKKRPPKGCAVYENRLGEYVETEGADDTSRAWFGTIVGQERPQRP